MNSIKHLASTTLKKKTKKKSNKRLRKNEEELECKETSKKCDFLAFRLCPNKQKWQRIKNISKTKKKKKKLSHAKNR